MLFHLYSISDAKDIAKAHCLSEHKGAAGEAASDHCMSGTSLDTSMKTLASSDLRGAQNKKGGVYLLQFGITEIQRSFTSYCANTLVKLLLLLASRSAPNLHIASLDGDT